MRKKERGNIGEMLSAMVCILAMLSILMCFFGSMEILQTKARVSQLARQYALRMECSGYLEKEREEALKRELEELGVSEISLDGTTLSPVGYGERITLNIKGRIGNGYEIRETRVSTAKSG